MKLVILTAVVARVAGAAAVLLLWMVHCCVLLHCVSIVPETEEYHDESLKKIIKKELKIFLNQMSVSYIYSKRYFLTRSSTKLIVKLKVRLKERK